MRLQHARLIAKLLTRSEGKCRLGFQSICGWSPYAGGEPLQYITGHQEFYGLDFAVTPDVLIPRPETEFLVERVIKLASGPLKEPTPLIVDIGTGSGCIAIALAVNLPQARLIATDNSSAALEVARANAERHGVGSRIQFVEGDTLEPLARLGFDSTVDVLASNPPYIEEASSDLQREVAPGSRTCLLAERMAGILSAATA